LLKLRRGRVVSVDGGGGERPARVEVEVEGGGRRHAIADRALVGDVEPGDEVILNVEAQELGLGSGGFDVVCADLTRGLRANIDPEVHVMKLNYSPIQHAVRALEESLEQVPGRLAMPVAVLALHGQLPSAAFAAASRSSGRRIGYVQTPGGALPGALSDVVADLLERGLVAGHVTAAQCFGGDEEAITLEGALHAASVRLGWDGALVAPGPGILGSASALGHGGVEALHSAHSALALGCEVVLAPRLSSGDERPRHRGLSHHTRTVLELLLDSVDVPIPDGLSTQSREGLERALQGSMHTAVPAPVEDLVGPYLGSGLPTVTMGRRFEQDEDFFRSGLAAGAALASKLEARV
jgi:hypothetical protein